MLGWLYLRVLVLVAVKQMVGAMVGFWVGTVREMLGFPPPETPLETKETL